MKKAKVLTILFRDFIVYQNIFNLASAYTLMNYGAYSFPYIFWIKVLGYGVLGLWYYQSRQHRLYFYHNLGWSMRKLIVAALVIDLFTLSLLLILTNVLT
ncbi:hypothetical protein [Marinoscillum sp.]|uniref:hypothetical protein n=1 Tax=Marinoscillum sp. TaxID=2024838 RepID=UPI003BA8C28D